MTNWKAYFFDFSEHIGLIRILQKTGEDAKQNIYILAYHRVDDAQHRPWLDPGLINASPIQFKQQMELLREYYHPVTIENVLDAVEGKLQLPSNAVLITVDDGYLDFKEVIFPICQEYGIMPTLFVSTSFVGEGLYWWDKLYRVIFHSSLTSLDIPGSKNLPLTSINEKRRALQFTSTYVKHAPFENAKKWVDILYQSEFGDKSDVERSTLTWDELHVLSSQGVTVAAHTQTHPILSQIPIEQVRDEIRQSQDIVRSRIGCALPVFAYTDGKADTVNLDVVKITREEGFRLAFTMLPGRADLKKDDLLYLPRLGTWSRMNLGSFHWHLTPVFNAMKNSSRL